VCELQFGCWLQVAILAERNILAERYYVTFGLKTSLLLGAGYNYSLTYLKNPVRWRGVTFGYLIYWLVIFFRYVVEIRIYGFLKVLPRKLYKLMCIK